MITVDDVLLYGGWPNFKLYLAKQWAAENATFVEESTKLLEIDIGSTEGRQSLNTALTALQKNVFADVYNLSGETKVEFLECRSESEIDCRCAKRVITAALQEIKTQLRGDNLPRWLQTDSGKRWVALARCLLGSNTQSSVFPYISARSIHVPTTRDSLTKTLNAMLGNCKMPTMSTDHITVRMTGYDFVDDYLDETETFHANPLWEHGSPNFKLSEPFSTGTMRSTNVPTSQKLTNVYLVTTTSNHDDVVCTSIRYGTPMIESPVRHEALVRWAENTIVGHNVCVLSFLDVFCKYKLLCPTKARERKVVAEETMSIEAFKNHKGVLVFQQLSANASIKIPTLKASSKSESFVSKLRKLCDGGQGGGFLTSVTNTQRKCFSDTSDPKQRIKDFVAISMLHYILAKEKNGFVLCYHCKSGNGLTGMFAGVHQTVHHYCSKHSTNGVLWEAVFDKLTATLTSGGFWANESTTPNASILEQFMSRSLLISGASTGRFKFNVEGQKQWIVNPIAKLLTSQRRIL